MRKLVIALLSVMLLATVFVGCDTKEAEGAYKANVNETVYGVAHKAYLGYMNAQTDAKGYLTQLTLDEIFMPESWAVIKADNGKVFGEEIEEIEFVTFQGKHGDANVAKYIYFNEKKYTAVVAEDGKSVDYKNGEESISKVFTDKTLAKKYHETASNYYIAAKKTDSFKVGTGVDGATQVSVAFSYEKADFKAGKFVMAAGNGAGASFFKRESGYWNNRAPGVVGLYGNYDYILKYFRENGFDFKDEDVDVTDDNTWTIGDIDTKATVVDFEEYVKVGRKLFPLLSK